MKFDGVYQLCDEPRVIALQGKSTLNRVLEQHDGSPLYVVWHNSWLHTFSKRTLRLKQASIRAHRQGIKMMAFSNCRHEEIYRKMLGLPGLRAIIYMFVDENDFSVSTDADKRFDAVYTAQLRKFKRINLAREIERLYIITYDPGHKRWDLHRKYPRMRHADFNPEFLSPAQRQDILAQSEVGLCLSRVEGSMLASLEYLLSGLPVVSTKSRGGRDTYYEPDFASIVPATPRAVAAGVQAISNRNISPTQIREATVDRMQQDRQRYVDFICDFVARDGHRVDADQMMRGLGAPKSIFRPFSEYFTPPSASTRAA